MASFADAATARPAVADFFRTLADDTRLSILRLLARSDRKAGELGSALSLPSNAVSYHLKHLRTLGLLSDHRSGADARDVYYRLDVDQLARLYAAAGAALHPGLSAFSTAPDGQPHSRTVPTRRLRVLFLCTNNSARSQLAEALMRHMGGDFVAVASAGSAPTEVHPDALTVLREWRIDASGLAAKPLERFVGQAFDYIITVCDRVRDHCPTFPGDPEPIHWSMLDPAVVEDPDRRLAAFRDVARELQTRIRYLLILPHPVTGARFTLPNIQ